MSLFKWYKYNYKWKWRSKNKMMTGKKKIMRENKVPRAICFSIVIVPLAIR